MKDLKKTAEMCFFVAICFFILVVIELIQKWFLSYPCLGIVGGFTTLGFCYLSKAKKAEKNDDCADKENRME